MAYALLFTANFGAENTGLQLVGRLYDSAGLQVGLTETTGFIEIEAGIYQFTHTNIPDNHRGTFVMADVSDGDMMVGFAVNPEEAERTDDILEYLQSLNFSGGESEPSPERTVGTSTNPYNIEPANFRMVTPAEMVADLMERINEGALTERIALNAVRAAINEEDHRPALALRVERTFDDTTCDYVAPCGGARIVSVEVKGEGNCYEGDCYSPIWWSQERNTISLQAAMNATARITMVLPNRFITDQQTITLAVDEGGVTELYIQGQPDIPPSGIVRICGEAWVYAYKVGVKWASVGVLSTDGHSSAAGISSTGATRPDGNHTILYAHRVDNCGRLPDSQLAYTLPGATVEFPLILQAGIQYEHLLELAMSKVYWMLMSSCRSDRDMNRFATLQKFHEDTATKLMLRLPKLAAARPRNARGKDERFRSSFSLRSGRSALDHGRLSRVGRFW